MPVACHILGNIEIEVKPGNVLISLIKTAPFHFTKKSQRAKPSQPSAVKD